ncbi:DUF4864 domain-containing protein [Pseudooceanicola sp. 502str34]
MARFSPYAAALMICLPAAVAAQDQAEIEGVISDQLGAFVAGDVPRAWTHASPMIQSLFGSPENFARMVREGYPMVWAPKRHDFLDLREEGGRLKQRVIVRDGRGAEFALDYDMIRTQNGWKINGVTFAPAPDPAV